MQDAALQGVDERGACRGRPDFGYRLAMAGHDQRLTGPTDILQQAQAMGLEMRGGYHLLGFHSYSRILKCTENMDICSNAIVQPVAAGAQGQ